MAACVFLSLVHGNLFHARCPAQGSACFHRSSKRTSFIFQSLFFQSGCSRRCDSKSSALCLAYDIATLCGCVHHVDCGSNHQSHATLGARCFPASGLFALPSPSLLCRVLKKAFLSADRANSDHVSSVCMGFVAFTHVSRVCCLHRLYSRLLRSLCHLFVSSSSHQIPWFVLHFRGNVCTLNGRSRWSKRGCQNSSSFASARLAQSFLLSPQSLRFVLLIFFSNYSELLSL